MDPLVAVPVIFIVVGSLLLAAGVRITRSRERFDATALKATGVVTDLRWQSLTRASRTGSKPMAFPVVRFTLPDGRTVETESSTGSSPPSAREGEQVTVSYDPADPTHASVDGPLTSSTATSLMGVFFVLMGGGFVVIGIAILILGSQVDLP